MKTIMNNNEKQERQGGVPVSRNTCLMFFGVVMFTTAVAIGSISAIYFNNLQDRLQSLEVRVQTLERKSTNCLQVSSLF